MPQEDCRNAGEYITYGRVEEHQDLEFQYQTSPMIYMVLSGSAEIFVSGKYYLLQASDVILINSCECFSIQTDKSIVYYFSVNLNLFRLKLDLPVPEQFFCNSTETGERRCYDHLRSLLSEYVIHMCTGEDRMYEQLKPFEILHYLVDRFAVTEYEGTFSENGSGTAYIRQALKYMQENYEKDLTLKEIADDCYISVPYLSKIFKKYLKDSVFNVLTQIRLSRAYPQIIYGYETIESVAQNNGFANTRSFTNAFVEKYGDYPSRLRRNRPPEESVAMEDHVLALFNGYVEKHTPDMHYPERTLPVQRLVRCNLKKSKCSLKHSIWELLYVGDVRHVSVNDLQKVLDDIQNIFHFRYAYISGIMSAQILMYITESSSKSQRISFIHLDTVLDTLLEAELIPMLDVGPAEVEQLDHNRGLELLLEHLIERYGVGSICQWLFVPGKCPVNFEGMDDSILKADIQCYINIYRTVKQVDPGIRVGSPVIYWSGVAVHTWFDQYMENCLAEQCIPDFFCLLSFPLSDIRTQTQAVTFRQNEDNNYLERELCGFREMLSHLGITRRPVFLVEWNSSISDNDFLNDSIFKAAYMFKHLLGNYDRADGFGYSLISDSLEMFPASSMPVHGGKGIYCRNGLKKPVYWAYFLLRQMGNTCISGGKGYFISKKDESYQIYLYNYVPLAMTMHTEHISEHFLVNLISSVPVDEDGAVLSADQIQERQRNGQPDLHYTIQLEGLAPETDYDIVKIHLTEEQCAIYQKAFDLEADMSGMAFTQYWNAMITPKISQEKKQCRDEVLQLGCVLAPGEVAFITIKRI